MERLPLPISFGLRRLAMSISNLQRPARHIPNSGENLRAIQDVFRQAMRQLAGGVSIITVGEGADRTGLTATSVTSLSTEPPTLIVCINQASSSWPLLKKYGHFGVNFLGEEHQEIADRFAGRGGVKGAARYDGAEWETLESRAPILRDALAAIDCEVEEMIIRHSHAIVIGRVTAARASEGSNPLIYWRGGYVQFFGLPTRNIGVRSDFDDSRHSTSGAK
jgi:flavin reductase (DIM6/NTAB) family NADH-FMN oxidoreductase RutF